MAATTATSAALAISNWPYVVLVNARSARTSIHPSVTPVTSTASTAIVASVMKRATTAPVAIGSAPSDRRLRRNRNRRTTPPNHAVAAQTCTMSADIDNHFGSAVVV